MFLFINYEDLGKSTIPSTEMAIQDEILTAVRGLGTQQANL